MHRLQLLGFGLALFAGAGRAGTPDHADMLRQLIQDAAHGQIAYATLAPGLANAVRGQAARAQAELSALGALRSLTLERTDPTGMEVYRAVFEKGAQDWAFHVDGAGQIDNALYRPAKTDPS